MSRNLKVLGLALVAVLAFSAVAAAGASAVTHEFKAEGGNVTLTGVQEENHRFTLTEHNDFVDCEKAHFEGTQEGEVEPSVRVHPTYTGNCETGSGLGATVNTTGCDFVFGGDTDANGHAPVDIDCNHENAITVNVAGVCTIEISDTHVDDEVNQGLRGVSYEDVKDPISGLEGVTVDATVDNITYQTTGAFCAFAGFEDGGTTHDGFYDGNTIVTDKDQEVNVTLD